jgi:Ca-activated chloride channel family protein
MLALDQPDGSPRLEAVKDDLHDLARALPGSRFSMVTFGGDVVRTPLPFTTDLAAYGALVDTLAVEGPFYGAGSMVDRPLDDLRHRLEQAGLQHPERKQVLVFLSDGENTREGMEQRSFAELAPLVEAGVVLGYGTEEGGPMPVGDREGLGMMTDDQGEPILSRIDIDNLERIGQEIGVPVELRSVDDPRPISEIAAGFEAAYAEDDERTETRSEVTWLLGLLLLALVLVEMVRSVRVLVHTRAGRPEVPR